MSETETDSTETDSTETDSTETDSTETDSTESGQPDTEAAELVDDGPEEDDAEDDDAEDDDAEDDDAEHDGVDDGAAEASDEERDDEAGADGSSLHDRLEHEGDVAADYLEELLDIADLDGDLDMDVEGDRAAVSIVGADLTHLVGERGEVLDALQELTRLAVYRETGERSRLMLDISGHRAELRRQLEELAATTAAQVKETGERVALRPMSPFERKVVHDAVAAAGLISESEGVEPRRYVVVLPA
jgi:spoIIIJ-associated protein